MPSDDQMKKALASPTETLSLVEAAALLRIHPVTLQARARAGVIPAAKIGRAWVFIREDLLGYIRLKYGWRASQGDRKEVSECHSTDAKIHGIGGSVSTTADAEYSRALGLATKKKRASTTTE